MTVTQANDALVGHTGFVGGTLLRQHAFYATFNSANIEGIRGERFDTLVCAAAPGSMFEANRFPEKDRQKIGNLISNIGESRAQRCILISSIAVLDDFAGGYDETNASFQTELAYGRHRRELEVFCMDHFPDCLVVRLPALFGPGLRKNLIFDLANPVPTMMTGERLEALQAALPAALLNWLGRLYVHDVGSGMWKLDRSALNADPRRTALEEALVELQGAASWFHHPETTYQFYSVESLWSDIQLAIAAGLSQIHLVTEPLRAGDIHRRLTGRDMVSYGARVHREDMRTRHAALWGRTGRYLADAAEVLDQLSDFFETERRAR
jgi:hypothetical protein